MRFEHRHRHSSKGTSHRRSATKSAQPDNFEELIARLSAAFVRVPAVELDGQIDHWLEQIVLELELDRAVVAQIDSQSGKLIVSHQWVRPGMIALPADMALASRVPWLEQTLMAGGTLVASSVADLSPEVKNEVKKRLGRYAPKSNVTIPLRIGGEIVGAVGFATLRKERSWSSLVIRRLQLVAEIFSNALERKRASTENASLRHELTYVSRSAAMGQLTASIAHQLNQPLAAILGNAEAIQNMIALDNPPLGEINDALADIVQDDLRASEIIRGLRSFFHNEQLKKVRLDPGDVVGEVIRMVRSNALIRNVSFVFESQPSLPGVAVDRVQLQQAIINLVMNAFDAAAEAEGPREVVVRVMSSDTERQVKITVRDTGKGIDATQFSKMFEPFFTTKAGGMGMGLTIAHSIIKAHGGSLSAAPNPDRGATFEISLPALGPVAA